MMSTVISILATFLLIIISLIYYISKRKFNYWSKKNVPHLKPAPIFGNFAEYILLKSFVGDVSQKICQKFPDEPYIGSYYGTEPALIIQSPELIKLITTKDFYYFSSREVSNYTHKEVITQNLFFTYGDRWKVLRQNFTPLFSSAKMRNMFPLIEKCAYVFENLLDEEAKSDSIEVRSLTARFTMDCIGSCAFGVDTNAMGKEKNNAFRRMGDLIFEISNWRGFSLIGRAIWPAIFYGVGMKTFPTELDRFFNKLLKGVFKARNYEASARNDFIDLLLNLKKNNYITGDSIANLKTGSGKKISLATDDELLVGQCLTFFAAGFETSGTTLSFTLYELAKNEEAQRRALEEIDSYLQKHDCKLGYECVTELPFIEACIDEALRLYPVLSVLTREVVEDYTLPTGLRLDKGVRVHIPVYHMQRNPDYFPDPEQFRPDRFLGKERKNIKPYTYMPFGEGPRICIGMRFAKMQMIAGLVTLLKKYRVELADGMRQDVNLEPRGIVTQPVGGINVKLVARSGWEQRILAKSQ